MNNITVSHNNNQKMDEATPLEFYLSQNYPNPFKENTVIKFCVAYKTRVMLTVYSRDAQKIATLVNDEKLAGTYEIEFIACNYQESGNPLKGSYFYSLEAGNYVNVKKMEIKK